MGAIIMELHNNWKQVILIKLQLSCNELHHINGELQLYNSCNLLSVNTHIVYKHNELQVSFATQKLNYKANYKTLVFHIV